MEGEVAISSQTRLFFCDNFRKMWFGYVILKIYFATKQALLNDFGLKYLSLSAVTYGVQCGVFLEQLSIYYAFYTPTNTVHPIFVPKIIFWCWHELLSRL